MNKYEIQAIQYLKKRAEETRDKRLYDCLDILQDAITARDACQAELSKYKEAL